MLRMTDLNACRLRRGAELVQSCPTKSISNLLSVKLRCVQPDWLRMCRDFSSIHGMSHKCPQVQTHNRVVHGGIGGGLKKKASGVGGLLRVTLGLQFATEKAVNKSTKLHDGTVRRAHRPAVLWQLECLKSSTEAEFPQTRYVRNVCSMHVSRG